MPVSLTSERASGAVANRRPGVTTWLMKHCGGAKLRARSGCCAALLGPTTDPRHPGRRLAHQPRQLSDQAHVIASCGLQQTARVCRRHRTAGGATMSRRLVRLHRLGHLVGRRDAVGQHVVHLVDDRDAVVCQTFGDIHLPQRTAAIQRSAGDLTDQLIEFPTPAGGGHPHLAKVIVEIDVVVLHPHRMMQLHRDVHELVAQRRQGHQPRIGHLPEQLEAVAVDAGHVEHADLQRVHVDLGRLAVEHQRVHAVESPHVPPRSSTYPSSPNRTPCDDPATRLRPTFIRG